MKNIPIRQLGSSLQELSAAEIFKIRKIEEIVGNKDLMHDLHRHDFFFILVVDHGAGTHEIDFTPYKIVNNSAFVLRPGQVHQLELKAGSTGFLAEFSTKFYHPKEKSSRLRFRKISNKNYCQLETNRFNNLKSLLNIIYSEYQLKDVGYEDSIKAGLEMFFIEFVRQSAEPNKKTTATNSYTQERFEEFMELLDKHIANKKQVAHYTEMMNLSSYQLNEITKSSIGKTASDLINEHLILEAKRYLLATSNQIKDIADQLGFEDPSYFIRFFKKHTGQSPQEFRTNFK
mgnify:CR=1 FL=1